MSNGLPVRAFRRVACDARRCGFIRLAFFEGAQESKPVRELEKFPLPIFFHVLDIPFAKTQELVQGPAHGEGTGSVVMMTGLTVIGIARNPADRCIIFTSNTAFRNRVTHSMPS